MINGLVNTRDVFHDAIKKGYAVPAFNFYNLETLQAVLGAAKETNSPVILAVSESALKYMGPDVLHGMVAGAVSSGKNIALHLDHGHSFDVCKHAIELGFSSVMIDGSELAFEENVKLTKQVVEYAHERGVTVEGELGVLAGIEDEDTQSAFSAYTDPTQVCDFVAKTNCDSLAIAIGTSHGAYKRKNESEELRFDILEEVARRIPEFPLVLHGASTIPQELVEQIEKFGGSMRGARGIPADQIRRAVSMNVCKVNVDSDARLAFIASIRESLSTDPTNFDPRKVLGAARDEMKALYIDEIANVMMSKDKN